MTNPLAFFSPLFLPGCSAMARLARLPLFFPRPGPPCLAQLQLQQGHAHNNNQPPSAAGGGCAAAVVVSKPLPLLELVKARQTEPRQGTASEPAEPRQSTPGEVAEPSQATLLARTTTAAAKALVAAEGGCLVVLAESVAWLSSATSPGVLCLGSAGSLAVPCLSSVCLVSTCSKTRVSMIFQ